MNLLSRLLPPQHLWNDPLFRSQARTVKWGESWAIMRDRTFAWLIQAFLIIVIAWLVCVGIYGITNVLTRSVPNGWLLDFTQGYWVFAIVISLLANLAIDFTGISAGLGVISAEVTSGRYELIRMSLVRPTRIVASKYMLAQVRVWRDTARLMWVRLLLIIFGVVIIAWNGFTADSYATFNYSRGVYDLYPYYILGFSAIVYVIEPYWRMKAVTAIGVALSSRLTTGVGATLASGLALLAYWLFQAVMLFALSFMLSIVTIWMLFDEIALLVCFPIIVAIGGGVIYGFYSIIQRVSLRHAAWRLTTLET